MNETKPQQAAGAPLERRTGEPHIDGYPLQSGLPPPTKTLTARGLLKQMESVRRMLDLADAGRIAHSGPLQVRESVMAVQTVPVKRHKKRRNQREAYHRRVQKKWTKRHGTKQVPAAYMLDSSVIGGYGQTLMAHPSIVARLKRPNAAKPIAPEEKKP